MRLLICCLSALVALASLASTAAAQTDQPWDLYLERCAGNCDLTPGANNAREYRTNFIQQPSTLSAFSRGDIVWNEVVECVRQVYAPFNVNVTDVLPPPSAQFHMAIVAGNATEAGLPTNIGGLGAFGCEPLTNQLSLTFDIWGSDVNKICATIAQESAHTFGLGHAFHCSDPMTYLNLCGRAFFRDETFQCGEFAAGDPTCSCSGPTQNSHRFLIGKLGRSPVPVPGPTVSFDDLAADQMVTDGFRTSVTATHMRGVNRVEFWFNGTMLHSEPGAELGMTKNPYIFVAPADLPDGYIDIEAKGYNDIGSETVETITVLKGAPCVDESTCNAGQFCEDGRCKSPIATGELGDSCAVPTDCVSGVCPLDGDSGFCSKECDPNSVLDECGDLECLDSGFCWPKDKGGCGCSAGDDQAPLGGILLFVGVALFLRRRRR